ncbi:MAG: TldD/PmbA family protein [FCB group bacterium]|nr:TldD/PmbA family protein [FCB group bacterium]
MNRLELAERLVERARKLGADEAEAYVLQSSSVEIHVVNEQADSVNYKDSGGYGLRLLKDGRMGFASSSDLDLSAADDIIRKLIDNTARHSRDEHNVLPQSVPGTADDRSLELYDETVKTTPIGKKIEKAITIEKAAKAADPRIVQIGWLQYGDGADEYAIVSSKGVKGEMRDTSAYGYIMAVGMESGSDGSPDPATAQTGNGLDVKAFLSELDPEYIGKKGAGYALRMLGAEDGATSELTGIFPPESGHSFVDLVADMISADLVQKKKSIFTGKLGEMVASDKVTIIDDGRLKGGMGSSAVDAEGVPTTTKNIIKNGRLEQLLYDCYTAHRGNTLPTGNAGRRSYTTRPGIGPTNFYLQKGDISRDEIIGSVQNGLYVTELSGLHASVDPVTGNFSIPCKGILIKGGELGRPVTNITVSGNIFDFFKSIDAVADDLTWEIQDSVIGVPTFRVDGIKVSGR